MMNMETSKENAEGILRLNDTNVYRNPTVWSHDPSMMWDPVTKAYYSYSTDVYRPECRAYRKDWNPGKEISGFGAFYL